MNEESLFAGALEHRPGSDRMKYLVNACGGDSALRRRLDELLAAHDDAVGLLDQIPDLPPDTGRPGLAAGSPVEVGMIIAGRYKLIELIGEGGMGDVYLAEQFTPVLRKVALKLIKSGHGSRSILRRFEQERQALAVMDHQNIAKVFDGGITDCGGPYFVMEYIKGVPITEYCDLVSMPIRKRLDLFVAACHAVEHAHQKVYEELRTMAARHMAQENPGQTLQPTALVNEAYLRLVGDQYFESRGHFFAAASQAMRRILIESVRRKRRQKRGGLAVRQQLDLNEIEVSPDDEELLALHEALQLLAAEHPRGAQLVELRFFGRMTLSEAAEFQGISRATADRDWRYARAWLYAEMKKQEKSSET